MKCQDTRNTVPAVYKTLGLKLDPVHTAVVLMHGLKQQDPISKRAIPSSKYAVHGLLVSYVISGAIRSYIR